MHSFRDALTAIEADHRTITVFAQDVHPELVAQFAERNATVVHRPLPVGYDEAFLVVTRGAEFLGSMPLETLDALTTPPITPPWDPTDPHVRDLFELFEDAIFASFDRRQMLLATREIEERAWRTGTGTLYVGFQRPDALAAQTALYERIATETDLDVHLFVQADWDPPRVPGATLHAESSAEIGDVWFLVFDGGDDDGGDGGDNGDDGGGDADDDRKCALVAEERSRGAYFGFWTFDPHLVDKLLAHVRETYLSVTGNR